METLVLLATVTQFVTERVAALYPKHTAYVAAVVGVVLTTTARVGLLATLGVQSVSPIIDYVLAGLLISGGAGLLNSLKEYLRTK